MQGKIQPMQGQIEPNIGKLAKIQNFSLDHLLFDIMLMAILDGSHYEEITKLTTMALLFKIVLQQKLNTAKFHSIFNLKMVSWFQPLWWQPLSKIAKVATMTLPFKIETFNKNKIPLILCQLQHEHILDISHLGYQPLPKITKMANSMAWKLIKDGRQRSPPTKLEFWVVQVFQYLVQYLIQLVTKVKFFTPWFFYF